MVAKLFLCIISLIMLITTSCTTMPWEYGIVGYVDADELWVQTYKKEFHSFDTYVSEELAIRCNISLQKGTPGTDVWTPITPTNLVIRSGDFVSVDIVSEKIYFCANGDLYSCDYDGNNLLNHTLKYDYTFLKPVLTSDRQYITMLSLSSVNYGGKLNRFDLSSGELLHLEQPGNAAWATFNLEQNKFFYFSRYSALYSINPDGSEQITHFNGFESEALFCKSNSNRFLGAWTTPRDEIGIGIVFDSFSGEILQIDDLDCMTLNPQNEELTYSTITDGRAVLRRTNLVSGSELLIHDGDLQGSDTISHYIRLTYRQDGERISFFAVILTRVHP